MRSLPSFIAGDRPSAVRRALARVATALGVLALLVQALLPLADAALHRRAHTAPVLGIAAPGDASHQTLASADHAHGLHHECPLCAFIHAFGGAPPPTVSTLPAPPRRDGSTAWPLAPPVVVATAPFDAQPRAPPHRI